MKFKAVVPVLVVGGVSFIALVALAADQKAYHGAICQGFQGYPAPQHTVYGVQSSFGTRVTCPLIRDHGGSSSQIDQAQAEVTNTDGGEVKCTLFAQIEDSGGLQYDSITSSTHTAGFVQLTFDEAALTTSSGEEGSYAFFCEFGPQDIIHHFYVKEEPSAD